MGETIKDYLIGIEYEIDEAGAQRANNLLQELGNIVAALGNVLVQAAGQIQSLVSEATAGADAVGESASAMQEATHAAQELSEGQSEAAQSAAEMAGEQEAVSAAAGASAQAQGEAAQAAQELAEGSEQAAEAASENAEAQEETAQAAQASAAAQETATQAATENASANANAASAAQTLASANQQVASSAGASAAALQSASASAQQLASSHNSAASSLGNLNSGLSKGTGTLKQYGSQSKATALDIRNLATAMNKAVNTAKRMSQMVLGFIGVSKISSTVKSLMEFNDGLETSSKKLKKSYEDTRAYNIALEVMGKDIKEINRDKKLKETFKDLQAIGQQLALPDAAQGVTGIKDISNELMNLKVIGNYALNWIYYKTQEVASGPLNEIKELISEINDWLSGNIEVISTDIATGISWVIQLFSSLATAVKWLVGLFDDMPGSVKAAFGALALYIGVATGVIKPLWLVLAAVVLLIDDLVTYMEGGESAFGDFWGALIGWIEKAQPYIDAFVGYFDSGIKAIGEFIQWLCDLLGTDVVVAIGLASAALWAMSANPIVLIIAAIVALIAGLGWLRDNWDLVKEKATEVADAISEWLLNAWSTIEDAWGSVVDFFSGIWDSISAAAQPVWEAISGFATGAWDVIKGVWDAVAGFFSGIWESIQADPVLSGIIDTIAAPFRAAWDAISGVWDAVTGYFSGIWSAITGGEGLSGVLEAISQPFTAAWDTISSTFSDIGATISSWFGGIDIAGAVEGVSSWVSGAWTTISSTFEDVAGTISGWFDGISIGDAVSAVSSWAGDAWDTISGKLEDAASTISGWFDGISISDAVESVSSWAATAWSDIESSLGNAAADIAGFFSNISLGDIVSTVSSWAGDAWTNITTAFTDVGTWFTDNVVNPLKAPFDGISEWFSTTFSGAWESVTGLFGDISSWATSVWDGITGVVDTVVGGVSGAVDAAGQWINQAGVDIGDFFADGWNNGWGLWGNKEDQNQGAEGADSEQTIEITADTTEVEEAQTTVEAFTEAIKGVAETGELDKWYSEQFTNITETVKEGTSEVKEALDTLQTDTQSAYETIEEKVSDTKGTELASAFVTAFVAEMTKILDEVKKIVDKINKELDKIKDKIEIKFETPGLDEAIEKIGELSTALTEIPESVTINVNTETGEGGKMAMGGIFQTRVDNLTVGEDGEEVIIPLTKQSRGASLLQYAASRLGMSVSSLDRANKMLGGSAMANRTPAYAATTNNSSVTNNHNVSAPATINVYGNDSKSIADNVTRNQEHVLLRNLKSAFI